MAVTTHMPAPLRDGVARAVAEIRIEDAEALDRLDTILDRIKDAQDKRNDVSHDSWATHPFTKKIYRVKKRARGSVSLQLFETTVEDIKLDAMFIYDVGMELMAFMMNMGLEPTIPPLRPRGHRTKAARKRRSQSG